MHRRTRRALAFAVPDLLLPGTTPARGVIRGRTPEVPANGTGRLA